tara:strand:+ start:379 stop:486 length:108 start_codon:yes stop_codon:yes gene_type:complete
MINGANHRVFDATGRLRGLAELRGVVLAVRQLILR